MPRCRAAAATRVSLPTSNPTTLIAADPGIRSVGMGAGRSDLGGAMRWRDGAVRRRVRSSAHAAVGEEEEVEDRLGGVTWLSPTGGAAAFCLWGLGSAKGYSLFLALLIFELLIINHHQPLFFFVIQKSLTRISMPYRLLISIVTNKSLLTKNCD